MALKLSDLPGIGPEREERLVDAGFPTVSAVAGATVQQLTALAQLTPELAESVIAAAQQQTAPGTDEPQPPLALAAPAQPADAEVVELPESADEDAPPRKRMRRGLSAAREIQSLSDDIRRLRDWSKGSDKELRNKLKRQADKALATLDELQLMAISDGLTKASYQELTDTLAAFRDMLMVMLDKKVTLKRIDRARGALKELRRTLGKGMR